MKTKDIPALVMLLAGGVYCLIGIRYQIPLMDFLVHLLIVLLVFWIIGGIVRMVLDKFMGEIEESKSEEDDDTEKEDADGEDTESEENEETKKDSEKE